MSNIINFEDYKQKKEIPVLDKLEYINKYPNEDMTCTAIEDCGKLFSNEIAKGTVPETSTEEEVNEVTESFERNLPITDTPRKKVCVARVNGDIDEGKKKRDSYLDVTQSSKRHTLSNGHSMLEDVNRLSKAS